MKIDIIERGGYKVSQHLERILNEKLSKLEKYFEDVNVKVVCTTVAKQEKLEITVTSKGVFTEVKFHQIICTTILTLLFQNLKSKL